MILFTHASLVRRHSGEGRNPLGHRTHGSRAHWIPAFAGMTGLLLGLTFISSTLDAAEEPRVLLRAEVAPREIHIGDRVAMTIEATYSGPVETMDQNFGGSAGEFEILSVTPVPPRTEKDGRRVAGYRLALTTFSTGTVSIPPIPLTFRKSDGTFLEARTAEVPMTVKSVLAEQGDKGGLRPLKGLYNVRSWWWLWALAGVALVAFILWLLSQRAPKGALAPEKREPLISPEDEARQALQALEGEPVNDDTIKEYYFRLSAILRRYIERRYNVSALEMTTSELFAAVRKLDLPLSASQPIRDFLESADLVKFAKLMPAPEDVPADVTRVRTFVEATTPQPVAPASAPAAAAEEPPL